MNTSDVEIHKETKYPDPKIFQRLLISVAVVIVVGLLIIANIDSQSLSH